MMQRRSYPLLILATTWLLTAPSFAQPAAAQQPPASPRETASHHLGIFYFTPSISISDLGYDSNVFNEAENPQSDFTMTVTPRSTVWLPFGKRALVTTNGSVTFLHYSKATSQRAVSPTVNALAEIYSPRVTLFFDAGVSNTFSSPGIEIERRIGQTTRTLGAGARFNVGRRLTVTPSVFQRKMGFDDDSVFLGTDLRQRLNRRDEGVRLTIADQLTSFTSVGVVAEANRDRFEFSPERNADGYRVAGSIAFAEKALVNGSAEVGYRRVNPDDPRVPDFSGVVAKLALSNRVAGGWIAGIGWDRDMHYSYLSGQPYNVSNALTASLRRQLGGNYEIAIGASRNRSTFQSLLDSGLTTDYRDTLKAYNIELAYRLSRDTRVGLGASTYERASTRNDIGRFRTTRVGFSATYVF